jgi:CDP-6-deoxy-D-xylo-4-hexulose-3-dehydrase
MDEVKALCKQHGLILIEDTCESLGTTYKDKMLGTLGDFGTYSFYYSHHMTTGEGGMVTCQTREDYDLLKCLRAHGWTRELHNRSEIEAKNSGEDSRFCFVNVGYNLRPMEVQAALGLTQLARLKQMNHNRIENYQMIKKALVSHTAWKDQYEFVQEQEGSKPVWFGMCFILRSELAGIKNDLLKHLASRGVENRPIVSGNFVRQPAFELFGLPQNPENFPGAEKIHHAGFFIGVHTELLSQQQVKDLTDHLLSYWN